MATKPPRKPKAPNVLRKVKVEGKWKTLPVTKSGKTYSWNNVDFRGESLFVSTGTYYLEYYENGKKRRRAVGPDHAPVLRAVETQHQVNQLRGKGVEVDDAPELYDVSKPQGRSVAEAIQAFKDEPPVHLRTRSIGKYKYELESFKAWLLKQGKTHLSQLDREDIRRFMTYLVRDEKLEMKTAVNRAVVVLKQMRDAGASIVMAKGDWPRTTEVQPDTYTPEELKPFFAACRPSEFVLFQTFLLTGFREQEIGFLSWSDLDMRHRTMSVTKKADHDFDPKNYMERTNPIAPVLVQLLQDHKARQERKEYLIFPTAQIRTKDGMIGGRRDKHMLIKLKKIAMHAGLNCGRCNSTYMKKSANCASAPICEVWTLHKFRHTYATELLREGWDILTVQKLLGHRKIESTMKYLRSLQPAHVKEKMDGSAIATMFV